MKDIRPFIDQALSDNRGYIPPSTLLLLWGYTRKNMNIIYDEFINIVNERIGVFSEKTKCPNCGAEQNAIMRICSFCNYRFPETENPELDFDNLVGTFENQLTKLKSLPRLNFLNYFMSLHFIIIPAFTVFFIYLAIQTRKDDDLYLIIVLFAFIFSILSIFSINYKKREQKQTVFNTDFLIQRCSENTVLLKRHYGLDNKVQRLISDFENEITTIKKAENRKLLHRFLAFGAVFLFIYILFQSLEPSYPSYNGGMFMPINKELTKPFEVFSGIKYTIMPVDEKFKGNHSFIQIQPEPCYFWLEHENHADSYGAFLYLHIDSIKFKKNVSMPGMNRENTKIEIVLLDMNKNPVLTFFKSLSISEENLHTLTQYRAGKFNLTSWYKLESTACASWVIGQIERIKDVKYFALFVYMEN